MVTDDIFAVIADRTRREILEALRDGDKAVGELVEHLQASQPTVSKHLKVLRDSGLVTTRAEGQKRFYGLRFEPLVEVEGWLASLQPEVEDEVAAVMEDLDEDADRGVQQGLQRTVGRAATRAADLIANLPKFGRRR